ncbi:MAG: efflux RND transporter periplasmic adaptor subunit [Thermodesulfovibrionales bacterium]|nr:efflux RND transporter periplasmic adaptor subunit [Thermodesulfovibrionales bacterium]
MKRIRDIILCLLVLVVLIGCKGGDDKKQQTERLINVQVAKAEKKTVVPFLETTGSILPFEEVIVSAEVDGMVKKTYVDEGKPVSKNMVIAEIDDTDFILEVKRAEATLRQAEATLSNTRLEFERKSALYKEELITKQQHDDVTMRLELADSEVQRAKASLNLAKQRLSKTKIYSPLDGYIKSKRVNAGDFVRTGTAMFNVIQNNPIKLTFNINERDITKVKVGQDVAFMIDSIPNKEFKAKVYTVYPNLDEKMRTLAVEARASNDQGVLKPGLFAKVKVFTDKEREVVLIPSTSIIYEADKMKVYVVEGNVARMRFINAGGKYGDFIEVNEGVKESESIVVVGHQNLSDGVKVNVAR